MATVRLHFPENEAPTLLNLTGPRITVGRLPHNTLQIIDRTISALHAEFIREGDHYRLHDRGSVNGTFVNGEAVTDYHLKDACKISFGAFECEFSPAIAPADLEASSEALPSRGEINEVRHENVKLRNQVELLRDEVETLSRVQAGASGAESGAVSKEEFVRVVGEMEKLKEALQNAGADVKRLKADLAVLQRDRANLQRALDSAKREMAEREMRPAPVKIDGEQAADSLDQESNVTFESDLGPEENLELALPEPALPEAPALQPPPFQKLPKPSLAPEMMFVPSAPKEPAAPVPMVTQPQPFAPAASAKAQPGTGSGVRPFAKSNPPAPQSKPAMASGGGVASPAPSSIRPPAPGIAKPFQKAVGKPPVATPTAAGPKGTQRISVKAPER